MLTWDENKAAANLAKHGVAFDAVADFDWQTAEITVDRRRAYGEVRNLATGYIGERLYVLVYVERSDDIRVISLRKANAREVTRYDEQTAD